MICNVRTEALPYRNIKNCSRTSPVPQACYYVSVFQVFMPFVQAFLCRAVILTGTGDTESGTGDERHFVIERSHVPRPLSLQELFRNFNRLLKV